LKLKTSSKNLLPPRQGGCDGLSQANSLGLNVKPTFGLEFERSGFSSSAAAAAAAAAAEAAAAAAAASQPQQLVPAHKIPLSHFSNPKLSPHFYLNSRYHLLIPRRWLRPCLCL